MNGPQQTFKQPAAKGCFELTFWMLQSTHVVLKGGKRTFAALAAEVCKAGEEVPLRCDCANGSLPKTMFFEPSGLVPRAYDSAFQLDRG
jgi:hypothetical protein